LALNSISGTFDLALVKVATDVKAETESKASIQPPVRVSKDEKHKSKRIPNLPRSVGLSSSNGEDVGTLPAGHALDLLSKNVRSVRLERLEVSHDEIVLVYERDLVLSV
jgi:hypothetical protein